ncbi:hypothetical protein [Sphingomonas xanthus]|uniref:Phytoene synthase n=1 Tax=Sphingomonas xanthus TaxID=2594473 RepID=A0A516INP6_9SPHN|nr:hypothetical protein [Sphingomonas xanthus]QDP18533.1 hypothetical protein FMM02_00285 [Sphingomonas xanthus]
MRDRDLVRLHWPVELRPAFDALFDIDDALRSVVTSSTQPALGAIRLAWWREALEQLDHRGPPPEPRLQSVAAVLLPRGIRGEELGMLEDSWLAMLDEELDPDRIGEGGAMLFALAARLLEVDDPKLAWAGRLYGVARARRLSLALNRADAVDVLRGHRFPRRIRPLTSLARLAARDLRYGHGTEPEATPGRAGAILLHRLSGRVA